MGRRATEQLGAAALVLVLGAALSGPSGQAQEQGEQAEREADQEQPAAQVSPFPIPVEVVEDEAAAEARERHEAKAREREKADLVAQQGMNAATQAMNNATQRMAEYSFWSTALVGVGTALLFVTLFLTWQANRAAVAAVEVTRMVGKKQVRAYLLLDKCQFQIDAGGTPTATPNIKNYGSSPAHNVKMWAGIWCAPHPLAGLPDHGEENIAPAIIGPGFVIPFENKASWSIPEDKRTLLSQMKFGIYVYGKVTYDDTFGDSHTTRYALVCTGHNFKGSEKSRLSPYIYGNEAD